MWERIGSNRMLQALGVSLAVQIPTGIFAAIATDGGLLFSIWQMASGLYWLLFLALLTACRGTPPTLALSVVRWAYVPILVLAAPLGHGALMNHRLRSDATSFAATHDQSDCVPKSLSRLADCRGFHCRASITTFTRLCLEQASREDHLCEDLIPEDIETGSWLVERCSGAALQRSGCERIHRQLADTCAS